MRQANNWNQREFEMYFVCLGQSKLGELNPARSSMSLSGTRSTIFAVQMASFTSNLPIEVCLSIYLKLNLNCRLHGVEGALVKMEPDADFDATISNNLLLDAVNSKKTNVIISSYSVAIHDNQLMHVYCGEDHIFMKAPNVEHRVQLKGVKQLQSCHFFM